MDDGNPCTTDSCDPATGVTHTPMAAGSSCSDGNACNGDEVCDGTGVCTAGTVPVVDDGNPCTADSCDPATGVVHTPLGAGTTCSDGDACNGSEACDGAGSCTAGTPPTVDDGNPCTVDSCDPATGVIHTPAAAGTSCPDGDLCNGDETCNGSGTCVAGTPLVVDDGNPCTADSCDPATGVVNTPLAAGASCADGDLCNGDETCNGSGSCTSGTPLPVDDGNPCTSDACDPVAGTTHTPVATGTSCADGNLCNGQETCDASGTCAPGTPPVLDDGNPCTADACDPVSGVTHTAVAAGTSCADGDLCNGDEACDADGTCVAGTPPGLDDGNPCTTDACDPSLGVSHTPTAVGSSCADGDVCNGEETCDGTGTCTSGTPLALDDGNPCTNDLCDPASGVTHAPTAAGTSCSDADACNGAETCDGAGACRSGTPPVVDDGNPCTTDACDPATGAQHAPLAAGTSCADGNVCNGDEACDVTGACVSGSPPTVDDGDPCTTDACDPTTGVSHIPIPLCDSMPTVEGGRFEDRASIVGIVRDAADNPITGYSVAVYDAPASGVPRADITLTTMGDGSFRARLADFPQTQPDRTPPSHVIVKISSADFPTVMRDVYLRPGDVADVGVLTILERDTTVTMIGPAGGTATDSQGLVELDFPPGAVQTTVPVRITPVRTRDEFPYPLPHATITMYGAVLEPSGLQFAVPVTMRLTNYRSAPTGFTIPVGFVDEDNARWVHTGIATWDGAKFSTAIHHFSTIDCNSGGQEYLMATGGDDPNHSSSTNCVGSAASLGSGSLRQSFVVAGSTRHGQRYELSLEYDSGLAGSRRLGGPPSSEHGNTALPTAGFLVPIRTSTITRGCAAPGASPPAGSCATGGSCSGGVIAQDNYRMRNLVSGLQIDSLVDKPDGADSVGTNAWVELPVNADGSVPAPTYWPVQQSVTVGLSSSEGGSGACAGGGGGLTAFGLDGTGASTQTDLESGPALEITTYELAYHRHGSPYGSGWGVGQVNELYVAPDRESASLITGEGQKEDFVPRPALTLLSTAMPLFGKPMARDPATGDVFFATSYHEIQRLAPDGSATVVLSGLAISTSPRSLAVTNAGGGRHFELATADQVSDIDDAGTVTPLMALTVLPGTVFHDAQVAAAGDVVYVTTGNDNQIHKFHLDDPTHTDTPIGLADESGDVTLDPTVPAGSISFQTPRGLTMAPDGGLYVACSDRHVIYKLEPQADGTAGPDSTVTRVLGTGSGGGSAGRGIALPALRFDVQSPLILSTSSDGYLFVETSYGVARLDPVAKTASWFLFDAGVPKFADLSFTLLEDSAFLPQTADTVLTLHNRNAYQIDEAVLRSELEPSRTLLLGSTGATMTDPVSDMVETYQWTGANRDTALMTGRTRVSGDPILSVSYVSGSRHVSAIDSRRPGEFHVRLRRERQARDHHGPRVARNPLDGGRGRRPHTDPEADRRDAHVRLRVPPDDVGDDAAPSDQ